MTDTPKKIIVDCSTGETVEVDLTAEELAQLESDRAAAETARLAREAADAERDALKTSARAKLVAGQPLTEAEAALLVL